MSLVLAVSAALCTPADSSRATAASRGLAAAPTTRTSGAQIYDLETSYPDAQLEGRDFLVGANQFASPARTSLWFLPLGDGAFKQFNTTPYRDCHWDLLHWSNGSSGVLRYQATSAGCTADHTEVTFRPGIAFMPKTWTPTRGWSLAGTSATVYTDNGVPVCGGTNAWRSSVVGLVPTGTGLEAVHTQTTERQTLAPIPGAPFSGACPPGPPASFAWQENFYLQGSLAVRGERRSVAGAALVRSTGGNMAVTHHQGHPQWDSVFSNWAALPPPDTGTLTSATVAAANGSSGNTIAFTFTAPAAGLRDGALLLAVPVGWSPPISWEGAGCTASSAGIVGTSGQTIRVSGLNLAAGATVSLTYGATSAGSCSAGDGAAASSAAGAPVWQGAVALAPGSSAADIPGSPAIDVDAPDGSGTLTLPATAVPPGSSANTVSFTYSAALGGLNGGTVSVTVPPGWSQPSLAGPGCATASSGTVATSGAAIVVSGLTLGANKSLTITYGATGGGSCGAGDGASAPDADAARSFAGAEASSPGDSPSPLASSPEVAVG